MSWRSSSRPLSERSIALADDLEALRCWMPRGAGLGLRTELMDDVRARPEGLDFVEVLADRWLHDPKRAAAALAPIRERLAVIVHGVGLSIASPDGPSPVYVDAVARLLDALGVDVYSEHLSFTRAGAGSVGQFLPPPFTEQAADVVITNLARVRAVLGRPVVLENVAYVLGHPDAGLGEPAFLRRVLEGAGTGLLLDLHNLAVNAANLGFDPVAWLEAAPLERVVSLHAAGGHRRGAFYVDGHGAPTPPVVFGLLGWLRARGCAPPVVLERDHALPSYDELVAEVAALRAGAPGPVRLDGLGAPALPAPPAPPLLADVAPRMVDWLNGGPVGPDDDASRWIGSFPDAHAETFRAVLRSKRTDRIHAPAVLRALGPDRASCLEAWFAAEPVANEDHGRETLGFLALVAARTDLPPAVVDLARYEHARAALISERWRWWWPQRREIWLSHPPEGLEAAASGAPLPEALPAPVRVTLTRRRRDVWVGAPHA